MAAVERYIGYRCGDSFAGLAFHSRAVSQRLHYPHPRHGTGAFASSLVQQLERWPQDAVVPTSGYTTFALAECAGRLAGLTRTAVPDPESTTFRTNKEMEPYLKEPGSKGWKSVYSLPKIGPY